MSNAVQRYIISIDLNNVAYRGSDATDFKEKMFTLLMNKEDFIDAKQLNDYKDVASILCQPFVNIIDQLATECLQYDAVPHVFDAKEGTSLTNLEYMMLHLHLLMGRMDGIIKMSIEPNSDKDDFIIHLMLHNTNADKVIVASIAYVAPRVYNVPTNLPIIRENGDAWFDIVLDTRDLDEFLIDSGADVFINISPRGDYSG